MKATKEKISEAYAILDSARLDKMEVRERFGVIRALRPMKKVTADLNDFREDAVKRLRPEGFGEVEKRLEEIRTLPADRQEEALRDPANTPALRANLEYGKAVSDCIRDELTKEIDLGFEPLSDEALGRLMESNPEWTAAQIMTVCDILGGVAP